MRQAAVGHCATERSYGVFATRPSVVRRPIRTQGGPGLAGGCGGQRGGGDKEALDLRSRVIMTRAARSAVAVEEGGSAAIVVVGFRVRAGGKEEAHGGGVAVIGGVQEWGPAGVVARVHGSGVCTQMAAEDLIVSIRGRLIHVGQVLPRWSQHMLEMC